MRKKDYKNNFIYQPLILFIQKIAQEQYMLNKSKKLMWQKTSKTNDQMFIEMNIILSHIIEAISQMKVKLQPLFLLPFAFVIRAKIVVCPENNWKSCFCVGCMLGRRMRALIKKEQWLVKQFKEYEKNTKKPKIKQILSNPIDLFEVGQLPNKQNQKIESSLTQLNLLNEYLEQNYNRWQKENSTILRFLPIFLIVSKLTQFCQLNLQAHIIGILKQCVDNQDNKQAIDFYLELKKVCQDS